MNDTKLQQRTKAARVAMKSAYLTEDDECGVTLFVSHHLTELPTSYWEDCFQTVSPEPARILDALILLAHYGGDDDCGTLDFSLPGDVTNYLICVVFDAAGEVEGISMES